jgi:hypothetical protein
MTRSYRIVACAALWLSSACDRDLYVGRDETPLEDASPAAPTLDAGSSEPAPAEPTAMTGTATPPPAMTLAPTCEPQRADCDGDTSNGCETDLTGDRDHCGTCNVRCEVAECSCVDGKLTLSCAAGRGDCDGSASNGCEVDLATSMQHCGACQRACHTNGHDVTSAMCSAGRCQVTCAPRISPEADCDGNPDNGCESYLMFDAQNCGQCGLACASCQAGVCMN